MNHLGLDSVVSYEESIKYLRDNCEHFQTYEQRIRQIVGDMTSVINISVHRMRNAESVKEADEAYKDVLRATDRMNRELPGNIK